MLAKPHIEVREEVRMSDESHEPNIGVSVPPRRLPIPEGLSSEAQQMLGAPPFVPPPYPVDDDAESWEVWVRTLDGIAEDLFVGAEPSTESLHRSELDIDGVRVHALTPPSDDRDNPGPLFIDIHGGGLVLGGGALAWREAVPRALQRDGITWAPDYRMPPRFPFPAGLDDLLVVYRRALQERPAGRIVVAGASAGGNLAAALLLRARSEGLPMPAALVLLSPHVDLSESGDSFAVNSGVDPVLSTSLMPASKLYAGERELTDPLVSPLFADLSGLPPTLLQAGTRDLFLSNSVRMHRRLLAAGVDAELHVFEAMPHVAFTGTAPEDDEVRAQIRRFESTQLRAAVRLE